MASLPTQVFPSPIIHRVPPTGMITVCRVPIFGSPGGQTVFMSPLLTGQAMPLHAGANIITTAQIPASNGVLMSPQPLVMAPSLHVARAALPTSTPCGRPKPDPCNVATLPSPLEHSKRRGRGSFAGASPKVAIVGDEDAITDPEDPDQSVLETSLKENGGDRGDSSSQFEDEEEEKEGEGEEVGERVGGKVGEDRRELKEKGIDHGDISFEIEDLSSGSEDEEESAPKNKAPSNPPPTTTTTTSRGASNGGIVPSPGATVLLPQQQYAVPNVFLPGNRLYQVVVPAGVHSNGAVESGQIMSVQQLFNHVKVEPYHQVKLVSVDAVNPVIGKEKIKQGSVKVCSHCGTTDTPLWRRTPEGRFICNACGIYWKTNHIHRPVRNSKKPSRSTKTRDACCANCGTSVTSLWRRDHEGQTVCNACGLYYKLHKENRPIKLKKDHIKTRKRRCRGSEDLEQATAAGHLTSSYTAMPHYPTAQGYVMMAAGVEPQRDQHSPLSDGSVTMVTTSAAPTSTQSSVY